MIVILCKSACLADELVALAGPDHGEAFIAGATDGTPIERAVPWLEGRLKANDVSIVFFETRFFVDTAPYRAISPRTKFVVISAPGEEGDTQKAIASGAVAMIEKPVNPKDVRGVLSLVSG